MKHTPPKDRVARFGEHDVPENHWTASLFPVTEEKFKTFLWWLTMSPDLNPEPDPQQDPKKPKIGFPGHSFTFVCHIARNLMSYLEEKEDVLKPGSKGAYAAPQFLSVIRPFAKKLMDAIGL